MWLASTASIDARAAGGGITECGGRAPPNETFALRSGTKHSFRLPGRQLATSLRSVTAFHLDGRISQRQAGVGLLLEGLGILTRHHQHPAYSSTTLIATTRTRLSEMVGAFSTTGSRPQVVFGLLEAGDPSAPAGRLDGEHFSLLAQHSLGLGLGMGPHLDHRGVFRWRRLLWPDQIIYWTARSGAGRIVGVIEHCGDLTF